MALSNPLHGERRPGLVGMPLPGVEVRLVDEAEIEVRRHAGELEVRGRRCSRSTGSGRTRRATHSATAGSAPATWRSSRTGSYRLLGRSSVDIIKTGGYKVSALEIEEVICAPIRHCRLRGGRRPRRGLGRAGVGRRVELRDGAALTLDELRAWAKDRLAPYKVPQSTAAVPALPRNAMGKVVKRP